MKTIIPAFAFIVCAACMVANIFLRDVVPVELTLALIIICVAAITLSDNSSGGKFS